MTTTQLSAQGQEIDIKGLHIGISKEDVEQKFGPLPIRDFSVAGAYETHKTLHLGFRDEKLDEMNFYFRSDDFTDVVNAVKAKYPSLRCTTSRVSNAFGGNLQQMDCKLDRKNSILRMSRFVNDINTSSLSLYSRELLKEISNSKKDRERDI